MSPASDSPPTSRTDCGSAGLSAGLKAACCSRGWCRRAAGGGRTPPGWKLRGDTERADESSDAAGDGVLDRDPARHRLWPGAWGDTPRLPICGNALDEPDGEGVRERPALALGPDGTAYGDGDRPLRAGAGAALGWAAGPAPLVFGDGVRPREAVRGCMYPGTLPGSRGRAGPAPGETPRFLLEATDDAADDGRDTLRGAEADRGAGRLEPGLARIRKSASSLSILSTWVFNLLSEFRAAVNSRASRSTSFFDSAACF
mmetsp:Transcript_31850/g.82502  ORF Transcript_31850/g.82502 Transcript_31850/m.82502 type:complete len:258 (-) Transcript_31850:762-1535(-)